MDKQAREAKESLKQLPMKKKIENFWYYYRWALLGGIFVVIVLVFTITECAKQIPEDLTVSYYSETGISQEVVSKMQQLFGACIEDVDGDLQRYVSLAPVAGKINAQDEQSVAVQMKLQVELAGGTAQAYVFDQGYYDQISKNFPEIVEYTYDMTQNQQVKEMLGLGDEPLYFVVRVLYENEKGDAAKESLHENAMKVYRVLTGEEPVPEIQFQEDQTQAAG